MHSISSGTDYRLIGKLLLLRMPEVAEDLLKKHNDEKTRMDDVKPLETDHEKIFLYFIQFCMINKKGPSNYLGYLRDKINIDDRTAFIAVILKIYSPAVFVASKEFFLLRGHGIGGNGLIKSISNVLSIDQAHVSRTARKIIVMEKTYEDFREKVNDLFINLSINQAAE